MEMAKAGFGALAAYRAVAGIDAAPEEFMKLATDALRTFLLQAETAIAAGDLRAKAAALNSAAKIVEFMLGLSGSDPGPLSDGLAQIYRYVLAAILQANRVDDTEAAAAGRVAIEQLAAVWRRAFPMPTIQRRRLGPWADLEAKMPDPIQGANPIDLPGVASIGQPGEAATPAPTPPGDAVNPVDSADLSRAEALLTTISQASAAIPSVDRAKVAELQALNSGRYQANPQLIAEKIMEIEALLSASSTGN